MQLIPGTFDYCEYAMYYVSEIEHLGVIIKRRFS
jgi:hypothetical protein